MTITLTNTYDSFQLYWFGIAYLVESFKLQHNSGGSTIFHHILAMWKDLKSGNSLTNTTFPVRS